MRSNKESVPKLFSRIPSTSNSLLMKSTTSDRIRKPTILVTKPRESLLEKRQTMRITDNGEDVTPKLLIHKEYEERQLRTIDMDSSLPSSNSLFNTSSSVIGLLRSGSYTVSSSLQVALLGSEEIHMDSLLSTERVDELDSENGRVPSEFHLDG